VEISLRQGAQVILGSLLVLVAKLDLDHFLISGAGLGVIFFLVEHHGLDQQQVRMVGNCFQSIGDGFGGRDVVFLLVVKHGQTDPSVHRLVIIGQDILQLFLGMGIILGFLVGGGHSVPDQGVGGLLVQKFLKGGEGFREFFEAKMTKADVIIHRDVLGFELGVMVEGVQRVHVVLLVVVKLAHRQINLGILRIDLQKFLIGRNGVLGFLVQFVNQPQGGIGRFHVGVQLNGLFKGLFGLRGLVGARVNEPHIVINRRRFGVVGQDGSVLIEGVLLPIL